MKVEILRNTVASGYVCEVDQVVDLSDEDANLLIRMGKAKPAQEKKRRFRKKAPAKTEG